MPPVSTRIIVSPCAMRPVALTRRRTGPTTLRTVTTEIATNSSSTPPLIHAMSVCFRALVVGGVAETGTGLGATVGVVLMSAATMRIDGTCSLERERDKLSATLR